MDVMKPHQDRLNNAFNEALNRFHYLTSQHRSLDEQYLNSITIDLIQESALELRIKAVLAYHIFDSTYALKLDLLQESVLIDRVQILLDCLTRPTQTRSAPLAISSDLRETLKNILRKMYIELLRNFVIIETLEAPYSKIIYGGVHLVWFNQNTFPAPTQ